MSTDGFIRLESKHRQAQQVGVVYGSLATTIIGLLSLEIASIILLLGAQVIAEYERLEDGRGADGRAENRR